MIFLKKLKMFVSLIFINRCPVKHGLFLAQAGKLHHILAHNSTLNDRILLHNPFLYSKIRRVIKAAYCCAGGQIFSIPDRRRSEAGNCFI
jgi:hypothetical protein